MTPWLDDGDVRLYHGAALEQLREMPSESVQCAVTSPPFYSLRDYNVEGQIGLEDSIDGWLTSLVAVFSELKRVLRSDGTFFCEIGDTYIDKQLAGAPWRLAFALQEAGWFLRSEIIWARIRPNPMPESVTDRPTKAHSYVFLLTKQARYYFDADAIREESLHPGRLAGGNRKGVDEFQVNGGWAYGEVPAARNARSVWSIPTEPTPFAHFATFPQALVERCIKAGTSERGACSECGAPWRRITERIQFGKAESATAYDDTMQAGPLAKSRQAYRAAGYESPPPPRTLGWEPSCACIARWTPNCDLVAAGGLAALPRPTVTPCVVLDPFMGSGTTALVARRLGRHAIGIELNAEYLAISATRLQQLSLLA